MGNVCGCGGHDEERTGLITDHKKTEAKNQQSNHLENNSNNNNGPKQTEQISGTNLQVKSQIKRGSSYLETIREKFTSKEEEEEPQEVMIGAPSNFKHEGHVGWDPINGFDMRNIPEEWNRLFDKAGVTTEQLKDKETANFIVSFVSQAVEEKKESSSSSTTTATHPHVSNSESSTETFVPPLAPGDGPPIPPPMSDTSPKLLKTATSPNPQQQEQNGTELLKAIREGRRLKPVSEAPKIESLSAEDENTIAHALKSALNMRLKSLQQDSDDEEEKGSREDTADWK